MIQAHRVLTAEGFNFRLRESVRACRAIHPGTRLGVSRGWSSPKTFWTPEIASILAFAQRHTKEIAYGRVEVWANVNDPGDGVDLHDHLYSSDRKHLNRIAGIYYPQNSDAAIRFPDFGLQLLPTEGLLLLFSPEQRHSVEPAQSERISIAFNAY